MQTMTNHKSKAQNTVFAYRNATKNWKMGGKLLHMIYADGKETATIRNHYSNFFVGFVLMGDTVMVIAGYFVVRPSECYHTDFTTNEFSVEQARSIYAYYAKRASWKETIVVDHNPQFGD
jgi:hypothetical protein